MCDNAFHDHLDICERCRDQPFNLCPIGYLALVKAVNDGTKALWLQQKPKVAP